MIPPTTSPSRARHTSAGYAVLVRLGLGLGVIFAVAILAGAVLAVFGVPYAVLAGAMLAGALAVFGLIGAGAAVADGGLGVVLGVAVYCVIFVVGLGLNGVALDGVILDGVILGLTVTRGWDVLRPFSVLARLVTGSGTMLARSGLEASEEWQVMCAAAQLMPRDAGRRWLDEAVSFLAEAPPAQQYPAISSYLITAPQVIAVTWAGDLARRARGVKRAAR